MGECCYGNQLCDGMYYKKPEGRTSYCPKIIYLGCFLTWKFLVLRVTCILCSGFIRDLLTLAYAIANNCHFYCKRRISSHSIFSRRQHVFCLYKVALWALLVLQFWFVLYESTQQSSPSYCLTKHDHVSVFLEEAVRVISVGSLSY